jgi:HAD superfamily hydrolase (TIGR01509 family)
MTNKIKAVIFDMDGVIIDSEPLYKQIQDKVFAKLGFSVSDEEYDTFIGLGLKSMWEILIVSRNLKQPIEEFIKLNNEIVFEYFRDHQSLKPMPGFSVFLDSCISRNLKTAVASSTAKRVIEKVLKKVGALDKMQIIVSGEEVPTGKPAPDIFLEAARKLEIAPENCLVIEDSRNGVKAAKDAKMACIGLQNPNSGNQDLSASDLIVTGFSDIDLNQMT